MIWEFMIVNQKTQKKNMYNHLVNGLCIVICIVEK
jgi:hypothetical protein